MADGLNRVSLLGNLGADPELRVTPGGQAILKLRLATTESYLDKNNARQERTEWHQITVWGKRGEGLSKILNKGDRVYIDGGLRTSSYEKDGQKLYRTDIQAFNVLLCGGNKGGAAASPKAEGRGWGGKAKESLPPAADVDDYGGGFGSGGDDGDIPF